LSTAYHTLISHDGSRNNNFTTIRIVLSWLVLYGHSYPIQRPGALPLPLNQIFEGSIGIGGLAVNGFFAISGFLVAASLVNRGLGDYLISRVLRIYPALILCVLTSIFVLGPMLTNLSLSDYFTHPGTWTYLKNALAGLGKPPYKLPGVFEGNPFSAVNGPLWTLYVEVRCYLLLAALTFVGFRVSKTMGNMLVILLFTVGIVSYESIPLLGHYTKSAGPTLYFTIGVFLYLNRDKVILDSRIALLAAVLAWLSFGEEWFHYVFPPTVTYLIFYLAYNTRPLRTDAVVGDISYGIYIFAWPVQQIVAQCFPGEQPYFNTIVSSAIVIPLAWLSWHYIEKPMLDRKRVLLGHADAKKLWLRAKSLFRVKVRED
jgi:peptidoglycan/LPS O-acetylase OafA/YrhL